MVVTHSEWCSFRRGPATGDASGTEEGEGEEEEEALFLLFDTLAAAGADWSGVCDRALSGSIVMTSIGRRMSPMASATSHGANTARKRVTQRPV